MNTFLKYTLLGLAILGLLGFFFFWPGEGHLTNSLFGTMPVTKLYFADHISPAHEAVINRFNELHQGKIEVIAVNLPFSKFTTNERKELLARSLRSKSDRLDVFSVDYIWTARFAKWCEPLDAYFTEEDKANILSPTLESCMANNKLVAMPMYIDIGMMYYRKDLLAALPDAAEVEQRLQESITWEELVKLQKRLGMTGQPFYIFQANDYEGLNCNYFELIASLDRNYFKGNTISINTPTARRALSMMVDFIAKEKISPADVTQFDENKSYDYWLKHDAMFVRGWSNLTENYRIIYNDTTKFEHIGRAALPHFAGGTVTSVYGGWNLMISKFSNNKEAAAEFIRFLQTKEAKQIMFELGDYIPVNRDLYADSAYVRKYPKLQFYRTLVERGFHRPSIEDYTRISDIIAHFAHLAIKGEMSVDDALREASEMISANNMVIR